MQKEEAERALQLLWEFMGSADIDDLDRYQALYRDVISGLHVYLTDILPASLPCLRARGTDGRVVEIPLEPNARSQSIDLYCNQGEKLGIVLDKVNLNGTWLSAGNQVSPIMVSLINHGSAAAKDGRLARGDQLLEIDGHPLSQCSLERARYILKAYRILLHEQCGDCVGGLIRTGYCLFVDIDREIVYNIYTPVVSLSLFRPAVIVIRKIDSSDKSVA